MATTNDSNLLSTLHVSSSDYDIPAEDSAAPYPPSPLEAECFYYGIPSEPRLVARSTAEVWVEPWGLESFLTPKEASPVGSHPLQKIWEATVGPAMIVYLDSKEVKCTSLDPVRMGYAGDSSPPVIVWMGVLPGTLSAEDGIEVATRCKEILSAHAIDDVHVEIRESEVTHFAGPKMYKPVFTSNPTVQAREPFSTALGLPICAAVTPSIEGTGGFYISDPRNPGKIYLVTARHVIFHLEEEPNELYQYLNSSQPCRNVLLFGDAAIEKHITAIGSEIHGKRITIDYLERRLKAAQKLRREDAEAERKHAQPRLDAARGAIGPLEKFLVDVSGGWKKPENRILGHVVLSPPIGFGVGKDKFTEDWAVIEIDGAKVDSTNFVGNAIDLGTTIPVDEFTAWMLPHLADPDSFEYPGDRLLEFLGTIPDEEMWKVSPKTLDHNNDPCIMVVKRGCASGLTVGRLNSIRSFTWVYSKGQPGQMSMEIAILPRNSTSGAFSEPGDSGSAVVDGKGRIAGIITGGTARGTEGSDCTYVTSINFLIERMSGYGLNANIYPSLNT